MLDEPTLETILSDPDLPGIAQTINTQLAKEREDRLSFREDLTPSVKGRIHRRRGRDALASSSEASSRDRKFVPVAS